MKDSELDFPTDDELACVYEKCKYPRTCQWNNCCMEGEMKKSLDAKMESGKEKTKMMETNKPEAQ